MASDGTAVALAIGLPIILGGGALAAYLLTRKPGAGSVTRQAIYYPKNAQANTGAGARQPNVGSPGAAASAAMGGAIAADGGSQVAEDAKSAILLQTAFTVRPEIGFKNQLQRIPL